jgi:hypothetical protein
MEQGEKMDHKHLIKQALEFNKTTFDNAFNTMTAVQEQTGSMISKFTQQSPWFTEEGKKIIKQWEAPCRKGREDFKAALDENYKKAEDILSKF